MLRRSLGRLVDLYLVTVGAWALAWRFLGDAWGGLALINAWAFWLLATALPIGTARLARRRRWLAGSWLIAGLALLAGRYRHVFAQPSSESLAAGKRNWVWAPSAAQATTTDENLRVLSLNVLSGNCDGAAVLAAIRQHAPDVVLIQELQPDMYRFLHTTLIDYTHEHWRPHYQSGGGLGVFSRYPLEMTGLWQQAGLRPYALRVTLSLPGGEVDVYNLHLVSVGGSSVMRNGFTGNFREREREARALAEAANTRDRPALLLGDCNMTEGNDAYLVMAETLTDAWRVAGSGPGWTWPRNMDSSVYSRKNTYPMLRLDYCFCNSAVTPVTMKVVYRPTGSDHCPIVVQAAIRRNGANTGEHEVRPYSQPSKEVENKRKCP